MNMIELINYSLSSYYFQEEENTYGQEVPSITNDYVVDYPSVIDRFFLKYYYVKSENPREAYMVMFHSNRVCLIGLAPIHPAFAKGIKGISFVIANADRSTNKLKGKGKKGGLLLQQDSTLAILTTNDNMQYKIPSCIKCKLIEVNTKLLDHPDLLNKEGYGYIAIVLPKLENCEELKFGLFTHEQFEKQNITI